MKKIMMAIAVVALATASQAAAMKWMSGTMYVPGSTSTKVATTYGAKAMLVALTADQFSDLGKAVSGKSAAEVSTYIYNNYKDATATKTANFMTGAATLQDTASFSNGDTAYAVVIYTSYDNTGKSGDLYYVANMGSFEFKSDSAGQVSNMGLKLNGSGADMTWQVASVPEPTSAMLLLLGMAGLALRRRRA